MSDDEVAIKRTEAYRASEIERTLVCLRIRLEEALRNLHYVPVDARSGHPHGYSIIGLPDWEARQLVDQVNQALGSKQGEQVQS